MQPPPYQPYPGYVQPPAAPAWPPAGAYRSPDGRYWWDGAQWRPLAAAPPPYGNTASRAMAAIILMAAVAAAMVLQIILDVVDISVLSPAAAEATLSETDQLGLGLRAFAALFFYFLAYIPAIVLFLVWIHRASRNSAALGAYGLRFKPWWAVVAWFIPFANLILPLFVVNEIWRASDASVGSTDAAVRSRIPIHPLLGVWWAAWIGGNLISSVATRLSFQSKTPSGDIATAYVDIVGAAVHIAAAIMVILVIRAITERQERKHARMLSGELT